MRGSTFDPSLTLAGQQRYQWAWHLRFDSLAWKAIHRHGVDPHQHVLGGGIVCVVAQQAVAPSWMNRHSQPERVHRLRLGRVDWVLPGGMTEESGPLERLAEALLARTGLTSVRMRALPLAVSQVTCQEGKGDCMESLPQAQISFAPQLLQPLLILAVVQLTCLLLQTVICAAKLVAFMDISWYCSAILQSKSCNNCLPGPAAPTTCLLACQGVALLGQAAGTLTSYSRRFL